jgi:DNA-binding SARP family transcriptional activator
MRENQVSFHVLGAVSVRADGSDVKIAAPRQRALLARLLLDANQTVPTSKLIEAIWGSAPPQHPESALHIVVSRLRRALGVVAPRLQRGCNGYRIEVDAEELDLTRAHTYLARAQRATRDDDMELAACLLDESLRCWSGEPLSDITNFPFYSAAVRQVREFRVGLIELRNSAYIKCDRDLEVLEDIESWIHTDPWRERLRAQQMGALYRTGRQVEALNAYEDLRLRLLTDFGVDPCEEIQDLHRKILRKDPSLLESWADARKKRSTAMVIRTNGGNLDEVLVERLREIAIDPTDVVIVEGGPGLDKDWLVVEIPRRTAATNGNGSRFDERLPRMPLVDSLAKVSAWLAHAD